MKNLHEIRAELSATFRPEPPVSPFAHAYMTGATLNDEGDSTREDDAKFDEWAASAEGQEWHAWDQEFTAEAHRRMMESQGGMMVMNAMVRGESVVEKAISSQIGVIISGHAIDGEIITISTNQDTISKRTLARVAWLIDELKKWRELPDPATSSLL